MKLLITYTSKTGNTRRLAERLAEGLGRDHAVELRRIETLDPRRLPDCDALLIGTWVHRADSVTTGARFIRGVHGRPVILFATLAAAPDSAHGQKTRANLSALLPGDNRLLDCLLLPGKASEDMLAKLRLVPAFVLPAELKQRMMETVAASRAADEADYAEALNRCAAALSALEAGAGNGPC